MFRLHIDIPIGGDEATAAELAQIVLSALQTPELLSALRTHGIPSVNYRLGHDEDRQRSNYFVKTASGHVTNQKSRITLSSEEAHED
jgi:hypothetical protein